MATPTRDDAMVESSPQSDRIAAERADIDRTIKGVTFCSALAETAELHGDIPALSARTDTGWETLSWKEVRARVRDLALGLIGLGMEHGQFAVIAMSNRPEHAIADMALVHAGVTPVSLYGTIPPSQLAFLVGHCEARLAIVENAAALAKLEAVRDQLPLLRHIVLLEGNAEGTVAWAEVMAAGRDTPDGDAVFERSWRAVAPDDLLTLVYTSGTTGTPKAVMLTHRNMLWMMESIRRDAPVAPGSRLLSYLPLAHLAERKITHYQSITTGAHLHFCSDIERFGAVLAAAKPHYLFGTPRIWEKLGGALSEMIAVSPELQAEYDIAAAAVEDEREGRAVADPERVAAARAALRPSLDKLGLADIAIAIAGGAPPAPDLVTFFRVLGVQICGFYGFTEMGGGGTWWRSTGYRLGTDGLPIPGVEIVRSDDGELVVRGGGVSPGYFKDPEATAAVFFGDGWVRSGDLGEIDDDGSIRIVGRKKELIITSGGKNISPTFVENMLIGHHLVGQACAIGDGRRYVIALLTLDAESATRFAVENGLGTTDLAELAEHPRVLEEVAAGVVEANSHLNRQEQVKRFVLSGSEWTITSGEMTPTMKMKRRSIAVNFADRIEGAYAGTAGVPVA